jgi:ribonuclease HI
VHTLATEGEVRGGVEVILTTAQTTGVVAEEDGSVKAIGILKFSSLCQILICLDSKLVSIVVLQSTWPEIAPMQLGRRTVGHKEIQTLPEEPW